MVSSTNSSLMSAAIKPNPYCEYLCVMNNTRSVNHLQFIVNYIHVPPAGTCLACRHCTGIHEGAFVKVSSTKLAIVVLYYLWGYAGALLSNFCLTA